MFGVLQRCHQTPRGNWDQQVNRSERGDGGSLHRLLLSGTGFQLPEELLKLYCTVIYLSIE